MLHEDDDGPVRILTMDRPQARNAVDPDQAARLKDAVERFEADAEARVLVLTGANGAFCAGADLKAVASGAYAIDVAGEDGPLGPTRMWVRKPSIAAVEGHAVAGGLELALMCDLRVASATAVFGVFCRRWGVPLVDGGTVRLPRLIGQSRAMDMILTGRPVGAEEALAFGLANRLVPQGAALAAAVALAHEIAAFPQVCTRSDRESALTQWSMPFDAALASEGHFGAQAMAEEAVGGAARFAEGAGRGGRFDD